MVHSFSRLTIFFEDPFWVGVLERESDGRYEACKITFGAEPKDSEVYGCFLANWRFLRFSPSVASSKSRKTVRNPKRMQRVIRRQTAKNVGIGTKAQQALKLQQEQGKLERRKRTRERSEAEEELRFALRKEKRKQKHRGH